MAAPKSTNVDLGFLEEECDFRILKSHFFPSKVGGKPAWLSLSNLPKPSVLSCPKCGAPCIFLLQAYAPRENEDRAFHRTIFVFVCKNPSCCSLNSNGNFKIYRSQLPKVNEFYSADPPNEKHPEAVDVVGKVGETVCFVCGSSGPKRCSKCHRASYCSREHQKVHWKGGHKVSCGATPEAQNESIVVPNFLFPEAELVMEEEPCENTLKQEKSESEKLQEYQEFLKSTSASYDKEDLEKSSLCESEEDKQFARFKSRIATSPDQVLRYEWGGEPLWISASHKPNPEDIPPCSCGAPRHFEFQILPQLLNHLKVDRLGESLDWGTLCVYTCSKSCDIGNNYHDEFLWKQDIPEEKLWP